MDTKNWRKIPTTRGTRISNRRSSIICFLASMELSVQIGQSFVVEGKEKVYQRLQNLKEMYYPKIQELFIKLSAKFQERKPAQTSTTSRQLRIKCMAGPKESRQSPSTTPEKVSTKFKDVFAFSGPAPETINGRLAMFGFVSAVGVEIASGRDLFSQLATGGVPLFLGSAILLSVASVIPMFNGVSKDSKSQEIMSSGAEMLNGRFAMLGLVALALTEYLKRGPLIS